MDGPPPALPARGRKRVAGIGDVRLIDKLAGPRRIRGPDEHGRAVGQHPEAGFALVQHLLRGFAPGDVARDGQEAVGMPLAIEDGGHQDIPPGQRRCPAGPVPPLKMPGVPPGGRGHGGGRLRRRVRPARPPRRSPSTGVQVVQLPRALATGVHEQEVARQIEDADSIPTALQELVVQGLALVQGRRGGASGRPQAQPASTTLSWAGDLPAIAMSAAA